jgi:protein import protein ZIM17
MSASKHIAPLLRSAINHHKGSVRPSRVTVLLSGRAFSASTQVRRIWQPSPARPQHIERNTQPRAFSLQCVRAESTRAARPLTDRPNELEEKPVPREEPAYEITFTCKPCLTRSRHRITKQGYHKGTVLITCPHCKNRHVISDHLRVSDTMS